MTQLNGRVTIQVRRWLFLVFMIIHLFIQSCGGGGSTEGTGIETQDISTAPREAMLSWEIPTTKADETPLTDLSGYKIHYGTTSGAYSVVIDVNVPSATEYTITDLAPATYYFAVTAYDSSLQESNYSNEVSKTIQ